MGSLLGDTLINTVGLLGNRYLEKQQADEQAQRTLALKQEEQKLADQAWEKHQATLERFRLQNTEPRIDSYEKTDEKGNTQKVYRETRYNHEKQALETNEIGSAPVAPIEKMRPIRIGVDETHEQEGLYDQTNPNAPPIMLGKPTAKWNPVDRANAGIDASDKTERLQDAILARKQVQAENNTRMEMSRFEDKTPEAQAAMMKRHGINPEDDDAPAQLEDAIYRKHAGRLDMPLTSIPTDHVKGVPAKNVDVRVVEPGLNTPNTGNGSHAPQTSAQDARRPASAPNKPAPGAAPKTMNGKALQPLIINGKPATSGGKPVYVDADGNRFI